MVTPKPLSELEIARIRAKLQETLGRDLTPEEIRYLGLSTVVIPEEKENCEPTEAPIERRNKDRSA